MTRGAAAARSALRTGAGAVRLIGFLTTLVVANVLLGAAWGAATGTPPSARVTRADQPSRPLPPPDPNRAVPAHPGASSPVLRPYPWAADFYDELERSGVRYWPYLVERGPEFQGRYLSYDDGIRRSSQPTGSGAMPTVSFFGGSTMFGEGQRDQGTIPSAISRLAEAQGLPVRVENRGMSGDISWSELLAFEARVTGTDEPPDLAVFYDGWNDCATQYEAAEPGQPEDYDVLRLEELLATEQVSPSLADLYVEHSLVHKVARGVSGLFGGDPAGAATLHGHAPACAEVYMRARDRALDLAAAHDVRPVFFWQPVNDPELVTVEAYDIVGAPTIDLAAADDGAEDRIYIDSGHMTEEGADLVAAAMWTHLKPLVEQWYRDHA